MNQAHRADLTRFPRYFKILGSAVNSYKVFLCIGLYVAILVSAAVASRSGLSTLRAGIISLTNAIAGLAGARLYFLVVAWRPGRPNFSAGQMWNARDGGGSVFGSLLGVFPATLIMCWVLSVPLAAYCDCLGPAILAGGPFVRLGCVFNGCCVGRETAGRWGVCLHDTSYVVRRRIPAQYLEIAWWLLGITLYLSIWPRPFAGGSYLLGVLCWYGAGRFWLESLRDSPDLIFGRIRINQIVALIVAVMSGATLIVINGGGVANP